VLYLMVQEHDHDVQVFLYLVKFVDSQIEIYLVEFLIIICKSYVYFYHWIHYLHPLMQLDYVEMVELNETNLVTIMVVEMHKNDNENQWLYVVVDA
jgi:hypothetical protein